MRPTSLLAGMSGLLILASPVLADFDIAPAVESNKITTNAFQDSDSAFVNNVRVFGAYGFGEDPSQPFFTEDPGFHPQAGSGFAEGTRLTLGVTTGLSYWNGTGPVSFGAVPGGETLLLEKGSGSLLVGAGAPVGSLTVSGSVPADGEFDEHLSSTLHGIGGNDPAAGIYFLTMQLATNQPGVAASDPFFVLFNNGLDEQPGIDALIYVRDQFAPGTNLPGVPEPSCLATIACAGAVGLRRRHSRN